MTITLALILAVVALLLGIIGVLGLWPGKYRNWAAWGVIVLALIPLLAALDIGT